MSSDLINAVNECESTKTNEPLIKFFRDWRKSIVYHIGHDNSSYFIVPHTPSDFRYPAGAHNGYEYFITLQQKYFDHKDGANKETFVAMVKMLFGDLYKGVDCRNTKIVNGVVVRKHISPTNWETFSKCKRDSLLMSAPAIQKAAAAATEANAAGSSTTLGANASLRRDSHLVGRLQTLVSGEPRADESNAVHLFCRHGNGDSLDFVGGKLTWQELEMNSDPAAVVSGYLRAFMRETLEELVLLPPEEADALLNGTPNSGLSEEDADLAGQCQYTPREPTTPGISFATIIARKGTLWVLLEFFQLTPYLCQVHVSEAPGGTLRKGAFPPPAVLCTGIDAAAPTRAYGTVLFENLEASVPALDRQFRRSLVGVNGTHGRLFVKLNNVVKHSDQVKYYVQPDMDLITAPASTSTSDRDAEAALEAFATHVVGTVLDLEEVPAGTTTTTAEEEAAALVKSLPPSVRDADEKLLKTVYAQSKTDTAVPVTGKAAETAETAETGADAGATTTAAPAPAPYQWTIHFVLIFEQQHDGVRHQFIKAVVHCNNLTEGSPLYDNKRSRLAGHDTNLRHSVAGTAGVHGHGHGHSSGKNHSLSNEGGSWGRGSSSGPKGKSNSGNNSGSGRGSSGTTTGVGGSSLDTVFRRSSSNTGGVGHNNNNGNNKSKDAPGASASASAASWGRGSVQTEVKIDAHTAATAAKQSSSSYVPGVINGKPKRACSFFMNTFAGCANPKKCTFSHDMMLISQVEQCKLGCNCTLRGRCPLRHIKKF